MAIAVTVLLPDPVICLRHSESACATHLMDRHCLVQDPNMHRVEAYTEVLGDLIKGESWFSLHYLDPSLLQEWMPSIAQYCRLQPGLQEQRTGQAILTPPSGSLLDGGQLLPRNNGHSLVFCAYSEVIESASAHCRASLSMFLSVTQPFPLLRFVAKHITKENVSYPLRRRWQKRFCLSHHKLLFSFCRQKRA